MTAYDSIPEAGTASFFLHRQLLHLVGLVLLVPICWAFAAPALGRGEWLGFSDTEWFWASVIAAIIHQVIVAFIFRALGGDYFRQRYREMPMVNEGAFAWSSNAMYAIVFLGLWGIALLAGSTAALAAALFQHAYIWVHYYCTEEPDMRLIYG